MKIRAYKQKIRPNAVQRAELNRCFGAGRWAFNFGLEVISKAYKRRKDKTNYMTVSKLITKLKKTSRYAWLNEIPSDVVAQKLRDLDRAYQNFFAGRAKYPRFRKRKASGSVRFVFDNRHSGKVKSWANGELVLPKLGKIKLTEKLPKAMPKMVTISTDGTGDYYASYGVEHNFEPKPMTGSMVGIDMGITKLATLSDGTEIDNPKFLYSMLKTLRIRQKSLSRKRKGSNRWKKQVQRVAKTHARIRDSRRDYLHKETTKIVENQDLIFVETLHVKGMVKNRKLSRTLHDTSMGEFVSMLEYKSGWYKKEFIKVDQWFASSKTCSCCGHKLDEMNLSVREWVCPKCNTKHLRDLNAAKNILAEGLRIRAGSPDFKCVENQALALVQKLNESETGIVEARIVELTESLSGTGLRLA
jgi:putative transposase